MRFKQSSPDEKTLGELRFSLRSGFLAQGPDTAEQTILRYINSERPPRNRQHKVCVERVQRFITLYGIDRFREVFADVFGEQHKKSRKAA